jgi:hypothetical protein
MGDWVGLFFLVILALAGYFGLRALSKPVTRTEEEFERRAAQSTMLGAGLSALQQITDPSDARAKEARMQMKEGTYRKKKREGKSNGSL